MAAQFRFNDQTGLIETDFKNWSAMREKFLGLCKGHDRETIAASIQKVAEDFTVHSVRHWLERTGARKLALAGGLFANVRLNRLLAETLPLDEVFVFPAMGDEGLSVGAALTFLHERDGTETWLRHRHRLDNVYLGQNYDGRIDDVLASAGMRRLAGRPVETAVDLIRAGKAGAIYTGRMEFGPRALGARTIIASPHDHAINDLLNKRLDRSEFMPFAPYVLEEDAARVFEITDVNRYAAHFMTITCGVKPEWRARIPAVVHVDGTARPQIVRGDENPLFAAILRRFRDQTELPVLINTSFNVHEEPIVNRPEECLQALSDGRVDFVVTQQAVYVKGMTPVLILRSAKRVSKDGHGHRRLRHPSRRSLRSLLRMRTELLLTHRTKERAPRPLHDALDRALAARGRALFARAVVDPEIVLEIAEFSIGAAMVAQRGAAGADRIVEHGTDRVGERMRVRVRSALSDRDGRGDALGREMRAVQRLAHIDVAEARHHALVRQRRLERGLLASASLRQHRAVERITERLGAEQLDHRVAGKLVAHDQLHVAEAARIVEGDDRAIRHVEHHMIVRGELAARVMEFAGALLVTAVQNAERARHAEMHQQHLAGRQIRQQILRAPVQAFDGRALEPLVEVLRKRKAQVRPALLDPHEARTLHHGLQAAAHGFDFGKFGHC